MIAQPALPADRQYCDGLRFSRFVVAIHLLEIAQNLVPVWMDCDNSR
jgi:hypothetical protein